MKNSNSSSSGIGFFCLLGIVFIVLKLTGVINWSWLWVLAPIWMSTLAALIIFAIVLIVVAIKGR